MAMARHQLVSPIERWISYLILPSKYLIKPKKTFFGVPVEVICCIVYTTGSTDYRSESK